VIHDALTETVNRANIAAEDGDYMLARIEFMEVERLAIIRQNHMLNHLSATFPKEKKKMASKSIFVSDISGNELTEKDAVRIRPKMPYTSSMLHAMK